MRQLRYMRVSTSNQNAAQDARVKGCTAEDAARLVEWGCATLYRHEQALAARESTGM